MNMIASCQRGSLRAELNGRELTVEKGDIFISPPNSILDIKEVSEDFACTAMCVSNHGLLGILRSHIWSIPAVQKARRALTPATTTPIASVSATRVVSTRKASLPILALQPRKHLWKTFSTVSSSTIPMPRS